MLRKYMAQYYLELENKLVNKILPKKSLEYCKTCLLVKCYRKDVSAPTHAQTSQLTLFCIIQDLKYTLPARDLAPANGTAGG